MGQKARLPKRLDLRDEAEFPNLVKQGYCVTSERSDLYNCIAHTIGDETRKWHSGSMPLLGYYWPPEAKRGETVEALISCFQTEGFQVCDDGGVEHGYTKVVLYMDGNGEWTHAALQLADGWWSSKLGEIEDIRHRTPGALCGRLYGQVGCFMRRPIGDSSNGPENQTKA